MLLEKLRCHLVGVVLTVLCVAVSSKKTQKDDTYGDLGDEIIVDFPSQPSRKNEIPKGDLIDTNRFNYEQRALIRNLMAKKQRHTIVPNIPKGMTNAQRKIINGRRNIINKLASRRRIPMRNKIARKAVIQKKKEHFVNPLFYREFLPETHPNRVNVKSRRRNTIQTNKQNKMNIWRKKDSIFRPVPNRRPAMGKPQLRRRAYPGHPGIPYFPRPAASSPVRSPARLPARRRLPSANTLTPRQVRPPLASSLLKPRTPNNMANQQKLKHHLHVQIIPNAPLNSVGAKKLGLHSGLVLMPANAARQAVAKKPRVSEAQRGAPQLPIVRGVVMKHTTAPSRFSERKHIWISSKNLNTHARVAPMQVITSYHMDDVGNLVPDRNQVKNDDLVAKRNQEGREKLAAERRNQLKRLKDGQEEDTLLKNLGKVATKFSSMSPSLRRNMLKNPKWLDALKMAVTTNRGSVLRNNPLNTLHRSPPVQKLGPRRRVITKKPIIRSNPKSSKRILFFKNGTPTKRFGSLNTRVNPYIKPGSKRYMYGDPHKNIRPQPNRGNAMVSKEYMIPQVSNKVYKYINAKTVPSLASRRTSVKNPLVKYLQYHRTHPTFNDESAFLHSVSRDLNPRKRDYRSMIANHNQSPQADTDRFYRTPQADTQRPRDSNYRPYPAAPPLLGGIPKSYYHPEVLPDGRVRPAVYPISQHIPPGRCLADGALCDRGHDEQCCGRSAFCEDYWGISKCVAFSPLTKGDMNDPYQVQRNRFYKKQYRDMLSSLG